MGRSLKATSLMPNLSLLKLEEWDQAHDYQIG